MNQFLLLNPRDHDAVERAHSSHIVYRALYGGVLNLRRQYRGEIMTPAEIFYEVMFTLDAIKTKSHTDAANYCSHVLWNELTEHLIEEVFPDNETAAERNASIILYAVSRLLATSGSDGYLSMIGGMLKKPETSHSEFINKVACAFVTSFHDVGQAELQDFMHEYMNSERLLSEEIDDMLDQAPDNPETPSLADKSFVYLSPNINTSLYIVLKSMYDAGWFVDENGKKLTSYENAIKEIMRVTFNMDVENIRQAISTAKNRNKSELKTHFDALLKTLN